MILAPTALTWPLLCFSPPTTSTVGVLGVCLRSIHLYEWISWLFFSFHGSIEMCETFAKMYPLDLPRCLPNWLPVNLNGPFPHSFWFCDWFVAEWRHFSQALPLVWFVFADHSLLRILGQIAAVTEPWHDCVGCLCKLNQVLNRDVKMSGKLAFTHINNYCWLLTSMSYLNKLTMHLCKDVKFYILFWYHGGSGGCGGVRNNFIGFYCSRINLSLVCPVEVYLQYCSHNWTHSSFTPLGSAMSKANSV